jgi:hypothetical protein
MKSSTRLYRLTLDFVFLVFVTLIAVGLIDIIADFLKGDL